MFLGVPSIQIKDGKKKMNMNNNWLCRLAQRLSPRTRRWQYAKPKQKDPGRKKEKKSGRSCAPNKRGGKGGQHRTDSVSQACTRRRKQKASIEVNCIIVNENQEPEHTIIQ